MAAKFRNRVRQVLYRPIKKKSPLDFVTKRLVDAEKVLDLTVGGALRKKPRKKSKDKDKDKKE